MRILISIPDDLLQEIDTACKKEERKRSQLIRIAVKQYLKAESLILSTIPKATEPAPSNKCDKPFCKSPSIGIFSVREDDHMGGTMEVKENLCAFHKHHAEKENALINERV
jgi:hypothetical protein